jgi:putative ABC transport system substrate-binding protein
MRRREFIAGLGGAAAWPLVARAQQPDRVRRIGFVAGGSRPDSVEASPYAGFLQGMRELGYVEGKDFVIEWRFADGKNERFAGIAAEFAQLNVDLIISGMSLATDPMRRVNTNIPIVMGYSIDPVSQGLVPSLARPGGNITGLSSAMPDTLPKQVDLLITAMPNLSRVAVLLNPNNLMRLTSLKSVESAAWQGRITLTVLEARNRQEIENVFDSLTNEHVDALIVLVEAFFFVHRSRIAELALQHRLPTMFGNREYTVAGGLMSYGDSLKEFYRRAAYFVDKIFKGTKPADLPIEQPTQFNLVINRRTADALGLEIPPQLLAVADEVIE